MAPMVASMAPIAPMALMVLASVALVASMVWGDSSKRERNCNVIATDLLPAGKGIGLVVDTNGHPARQESGGASAWPHVPAPVSLGPDGARGPGPPS